MIEFKNVSKSFGEKKVLNELNFKLNEGEIFFILGRSGTGKSVTLKLIVGLLKPEQGEIYVDHELINNFSEEELFSVRQKCGMVFQHPALLDSLTIFENIAFGLKSNPKKNLHKSEIEEKVIKSLKLVHLNEDILYKKPPEISYGMQKRVSLARTLVIEPKILLFDEPTTGLDPITTSSINELIIELSKKLKVTSLVVSHDMICALKAASRILFLDQGKPLFLGTVNEIQSEQNPLIQDFLMETKL
jgi:phospholipid/cholesterol/gamma-HCH transport system ATP-binding protein